MSRFGKPIEAESRLVVTWGWTGGNAELGGNGYKAFLGGDENVLKLIIVMVA